jgi:hypothetical protein
MHQFVRAASSGTGHGLENGELFEEIYLVCNAPESDNPRLGKI